MMSQYALDTMKNKISHRHSAAERSSIGESSLLGGKVDSTIEFADNMSITRNSDFPAADLPRFGSMNIHTGGEDISEDKSTIQKNMNKILSKRAQEEDIEVDEIKEILPCSIEALDHMDELFLEGQSKLVSELKHA